MKKKIFSLCLGVALAATAIIGGTLAYFTDTDKATNTFTTANVKIDLIEQQRNDEGTALEDFENNKVLMPIVGSAQGEKDQFGLATAENYVDKIVTVKNLASDAYVRVYYAIPEALDNVTDAGKNVLHVNAGNKFVADGNKTDSQAINDDFTGYMGDETLLYEAYNINGASYNIYYRDYNKILTKDEVTGAAFIVGLYLDKGVDYDNDNGCYTINDQKIDYDFSNGVNIPVFAVGVQSSGFEETGCAAAVEAAFGANYNPWATDTE